MNQTRRSILKSIGAGTATVSVMSGMSSANDTVEVNGQDPRLSTIKTDSLQQRAEERAYEQVSSTQSGKDMIAFLRSNSYTIAEDDLSGKKISVDDGHDHTMLTAPIKSERRGGEATDVLVFRMFEEGVTAHATIDGQGYGTIPAGDKLHDSISTGTDSVVPIAEIHRQARNIGDVGPEWSISCLASGTFSATGPACTFLQGFAAILAGVLIIVPEPGSTVVGTAALSVILGGSCTIGRAIENATGCCSVFDIGICVGVPMPWNPAPVHAYPANGFGC